jgi:hypothetical protein
MNKFDRYFESLSTSHRIMLYLLPILIIYLYHLQFYKKPKSQTNQTISHTQYKNNMLKTLAKIEHKIKKSKVRVRAINLKSNRRVEIEFFSKSFTKVQTLLNYISQYAYISKLSMSYNNREIQTKLICNNLPPVEIIKNSEVNSPFTRDKKRKYFKLKAIIGEFVQIDNQLLKLGDIYRGYQVVKLTTFSVKLKKDDEVKVLKLSKRI